MPESTYDQHLAASKAIQKDSDKWLMAGAIGMGSMILGLIGLPLFIYGLYRLNKAANQGYIVRPILVSIIGYVIIVDAAINSFGWGLDLVANHSLIGRVIWLAWGNFIDGGYFWHYNDLAVGGWEIGGATAPGEKSYEIMCICTVFTMRIAAAIGFLQMKRWGFQWLIVTCWMGVVIWTGYLFNMLFYADVRYAGTAFPVLGWWAFDIFYITPFVAIPYLHTVNRELFSE